MAAEKRLTSGPPGPYDAGDLRCRGTGGGGFPPQAYQAHPGILSEVRTLDSKRPLAVNAARLVALSLIAVVACDEETSVTPPPPAPQITTRQTYAKASNGLPNSDVNAMLTLPNGEFWIGTEQGIARYASINETTRLPGPNGLINELNGLPNPKVRDIVEMNGKVYVATWGGGFAIYDAALGTWTSKTSATDGGDDVQVVPFDDTMTANNPVITPGPNGILESSPRGDDRVNGTRILDGGNARAESRAWTLDGSIADIEVSPNEDGGKVYFATNVGISIYEPAGDRFTSFSFLTRDVVSAVSLRDTPGGVERWYGPRVESIEDESQGPLPEAGITVSPGASPIFTYTKLNSGLLEPNVNTIFRDAVAGDDVFWVATASAGVSRVEVGASTWTSYSMLHGLPSNTVYSVTRANNTIWVATQNGIARLKSDGTWQGYNTSGGLAVDRVRLVYSDDGANLWVGYVNGGAARLNPASAQ